MYVGYHDANTVSNVDGDPVRQLNLKKTFYSIIKRMMFASFHSKGTIPSCSDMLNTCASGVLICYKVSFSIIGDIPSPPGDLFSFILLILLATTVTASY